MNIFFVLKMLGVGLIIGTALLAMSLLELYTQLARYKTYWERNNEKSAQDGEILYIALGDSTAQGIGASHPDKGYTSIIRKKLAEREKKPVRLVNLSKSGATIKDVLAAQLPAMKKLGVSERTVVTIEIGANDILVFNPKMFESEMDELMGKLPPQTVMSDIPTFKQSRFNSREPDVLQANEIMYKLATKHGLQLAPLHARMLQRNGIRNFAADLFHPSNAAYSRNWAPVFLEQIPTPRKGF